MERLALRAEDVDRIRNGGGTLEEVSQLQNALLSKTLDIIEDAPIQPQEVIDDSIPIQEVPQDIDMELQAEPPVNEVEENNGEEFPIEDKQSKYLEYVQQQEKEAKERNLKLQEELDQLKSNLEAKDRLLNEIKEQKVTPVQQSPTNPSYSDEDTDYVTEFEKNTRQQVLAIKDQISKLKSGDPEVEDLKSQMSTILANQRKIDEKEAQEKEERRLRELENKVYTEVVEFQNSTPDYKTSKDVKLISEEWRTFRDQLANVLAINPNDEEAINRAEALYSGKYDGSNVFNQMEARGIKPPEDYEKFKHIQDLYNRKNGFYIDEMSGKKIDITNAEGQKIVYGDISEVYYLQNRQRLEAEALKKASVEIQNKISNRNNSAVTIDNSNTAKVGGGLSREVAMQYINMSVNDVRKLNPVERENWTTSWIMYGGGLPDIPGL